MLRGEQILRLDQRWLRDGRRVETERYPPFVPLRCPFVLANTVEVPFGAHAQPAAKAPPCGVHLAEVTPPVQRPEKTLRDVLRLSLARAFAAKKSIYGPPIGVIELRSGLPAIFSRRSQHETPARRCETPLLSTLQFWLCRHGFLTGFEKQALPRRYSNVRVPSARHRRAGARPSKLVQRPRTGACYRRSPDEKIPCPRFVGAPVWHDRWCLRRQKHRRLLFQRGGPGRCCQFRNGQAPMTAPSRSPECDTICAGECWSRLPFKPKIALSSGLVEGTA